MSEILDEASKKAFLAIARTAQVRDFGRIADFLKRKGIKKLFHFTHISNLESIMIDGLQTRHYLNKSQKNYQATDKDRLDNFTESISFSIGEPNRLLLPRKIHDFSSQLVLLEVSANSLLTQNFAAFPSNAAGGYFQKEILGNPERYVGIRGLEGIYLNRELRNKARLPIDVPTDTQSEILFFDQIAPDKIQKVHIPSTFPLNARATVDKLRSEEDSPQFELVCECGLFNRQEPVFRRYDIGWESNG
jgi:hypothetical protein